MTAAYSAFHPKNKRLLLRSNTSVKGTSVNDLFTTNLSSVSVKASTIRRLCWKAPAFTSCSAGIICLLPPSFSLPCRLITSFPLGVQLLCNPKTTSKGQFMPSSLGYFCAHPQDTQCQQSSLVSLLSLDVQNLPFGSGGNFSAQYLV